MAVQVDAAISASKWQVMVHGDYKVLLFEDVTVNPTELLYSSWMAYL